MKLVNPMAVTKPTPNLSKEGNGTVEESTVLELAAVKTFNEAFGYDLIWPLDEFAARNAMEIANLRDRQDIAEEIRKAFKL